MTHISKNADDTLRLQNAHCILDCSHCCVRPADDFAVAAGEKAQIEAHKVRRLDMLLFRVAPL